MIRLQRSYASFVKRKYCSTKDTDNERANDTDDYTILK